MGDDDARLWHELAQLAGGLFNVGDLVVDVEDLAVAKQLAPDRCGNLLVLLRAHIRQHRVAVFRRGGDRGHLADACQRHLEGSRDRRRRHGQHVHVGLQRLDVLLVLDAEALLLVDDDQPQVLPLHARLQEAVGADDHVDRAVCKTSHDLLRVRSGGEAGQLPHGHAEAVHTLVEGGEVLLGQKRGGHEHGDLLAVLDCLERGAHGHLGFTEADVADNYPVHRGGLFHVRLHGFDGGELVFRLHEWEGVFHLVLPRGVRCERVARGGLALGVQLHQLAGDLANRRARFALGGFPVRAAHFA